MWGCSPKNGEKRKRALSGASLAAAMANHPHVLFDDEGVGRSPRSVAAKARYTAWLWPSDTCAEVYCYHQQPLQAGPRLMDGLRRLQTLMARYEVVLSFESPLR